MALESILNHIIGNANSEAENIVKKARQETDILIAEAREKTEIRVVEFVRERTEEYEKLKQKMIVNARLEARKKILQEKQDLISRVFEQLKPELTNLNLMQDRVMFDSVQPVPAPAGLYADNLRADFEQEIADILFEDHRG
ncbi:MAG: V-type ATP synthase subunit E [Candidatus Omnitrophica bacterium]|nr:V-type ATP synthase subunit E [Candidatus Omnitrophota bacterium]